jgi:cysteine desulfurase
MPARIMRSPVEHDAVLRVTAGNAERLVVDADGMRSGCCVILPGGDDGVAIQHVNNETGVIQPFVAIAAEPFMRGGWLLLPIAPRARASLTCRMRT